MCSTHTCCSMQNTCGTTHSRNKRPNSSYPKDTRFFNRLFLKLKLHIPLKNKTPVSTKGYINIIRGNGAGEAIPPWLNGVPPLHWDSFRRTDAHSRKPAALTVGPHKGDTVAIYYPGLG